MFSCKGWWNNGMFHGTQFLWFVPRVESTVRVCCRIRRSYVRWLSVLLAPISVSFWYFWFGDASSDRRDMPWRRSCKQVKPACRCRFFISSTVRNIAGIETRATIAMRGERCRFLFWLAYGNIRHRHSRQWFAGGPGCQNTLGFRRTAIDRQIGNFHLVGFRIAPPCLVASTIARPPLFRASYWRNLFRCSRFR